MSDTNETMTAAVVRKVRHAVHVAARSGCPDVISIGGGTANGPATVHVFGEPYAWTGPLDSDEAWERVGTVFPPDHGMERSVKVRLLVGTDVEVFWLAPCFDVQEEEHRFDADVQP